MDTPPDPVQRPFDEDKAVQSMTECERFCNFANPDVKTLEEDENWEENISKYVLTRLREVVV